MPFPIGHALVGAGLFTATRLENDFSNLKLLILCSALTIIPDADFTFTWLFDLDGWHRGFTHSIVFGLAIAFVAILFGNIRNTRDIVALLLASISHTLLDALTTRVGTGVELLWPVTTYRFRFGLFDYFSFNLNPKINPWSDIVFQLIKVTAIELIVLGPILMIFVFVKRKCRKVCLMDT